MVFVVFVGFFSIVGFNSRYLYNLNLVFFIEYCYLYMLAIVVEFFLNLGIECVILNFVRVGRLMVVLLRMCALFSFWKGFFIVRLSLFVLLCGVVTD